MEGYGGVTEMLGSVTVEYSLIRALRANTAAA
jgi:hypothetical protein